MSETFRNPANGYEERATSPLTWLWVFLFCPFYLLARGLWAPLVVYAAIVVAVVLSGGLGVVFLILAHAIMPFFITGQIRKAYLRRGWEPAGSTTILPASVHAAAKSSISTAALAVVALAIVAGLIALFIHVTT